MAHIFVKNSLSHLKATKIDVNLPVFVTTDSKGDPIYVLEVATTYPSASGTAIRPSYINKVTSFEELDLAMQSAVSEIASQIDWLPLMEDEDPPYLTEHRPQGAEVSIASNILINIREDAPTAGIDLSEAKVLLTTEGTEFDITSDCLIEGTPFEYTIHWEPLERVHKRYDEE